MSMRHFLSHTLVLCTAVFMCLGSKPAMAQEPYQISAPLDIPLTIAGVAVSGLGSYLNHHMEIPSSIRSKEDFLPWDRHAVGNYSETADLMSDIGIGLAAAPLVIGGISWYQGTTDGTGFATFSLMFAQAILFENGINLAVRSLEIWPRPYIYSNSEKGKETAMNAKGEAYGSFYSGHVSAAFTVAVFTSEWFDYAYPNSPYSGLVRSIAFSAAGLEGALRVAAGKHYPTDVIVGALMGTGISYGILFLHKKRNEKYSLQVAPNAVNVTFRF